MSRQKSQEAYSSRIPIFHGTNYAFRKVIMEFFHISMGLDVWPSILVDYNVPNIPPTNANGKIL